MSVISGSLRKLAIRRGGSSGTWEVVAHVVSDNWNTQTDFIETTTRDNKGFKSFIPIALGSTIEATGVIFQDGDLTGKIGWKTLKEVQEAFEKIEYRMQVIGENYTYHGNMYVSSIGDTAEVSGLLEYSISFQVTDKPVLLGDNTVPTAPFLNELEPDTFSTQITLSWVASTDDVGVAGYEVRKIEDSLPQVLIDVGNVLTWVDQGGQQGALYSYNVRSYDLAGNYSPWSNKRLLRLAIPLTPGDVLSYILQENNELILTEDNSSIIQEG